MSNPTDSYPSNIDFYRLLTQLYGSGPFGPSPSPNWSVPNPSPLSVSTSDVPGFHKSPAVLEALAATDPRPAGFYRSPSLLGSGTPTPTDPPPAMDPQTALFRWLGIPPSWFPSPPKVSDTTTSGIDLQVRDNALDPERLEPGATQPAAAGDLRCQGYSSGCQNGGDYGTTATHIVGGRLLCRKCALKKLGIEESAPAEQIKTLRPYEF
jgi:hypothetical protein